MCVRERAALSQRRARVPLPPPRCSEGPNGWHRTRRRGSEMRKGFPMLRFFWLSSRTFCSRYRSSNTRIAVRIVGSAFETGAAFAAARSADARPMSRRGSRRTSLAMAPAEFTPYPPRPQCAWDGSRCPCAAVAVRPPEGARKCTVCLRPPRTGCNARTCTRECLPPLLAGARVRALRHVMFREACALVCMIVCDIPPYTNIRMRPPASSESDHAQDMWLRAVKTLSTTTTAMIMIPFE